MITQERLKELFHYNPDTGDFTRLTSVCGTAMTGASAGWIASNGYLYIGVDYKKHLLHRLAWLYTYGKFPLDEIDHINHIRVDNRISNLREATRKENGRNTSLHSDNTSGVSGVSWHKRAKKWRARITVDHEEKFLGHFHDFESACAARRFAEIKHGFHQNHGKREGEDL